MVLECLRCHHFCSHVILASGDNEASSIPRPDYFNTSLPRGLRVKLDNSNSGCSFWLQTSPRNLPTVGIVACIRFPAVLLAIYITSTSFGTIMMVHQLSAGLCWTNHRIFDSIQIGLASLPMALGLILGDIMGGRYINPKTA